MRSNPTPTEATLWYHLRAGRAEYKFRRQQRIGTYIVDFYCPRSWLIIELDGDSHAEQVEYDEARTAWLQGGRCAHSRESTSHLASIARS